MAKVSRTSSAARNMVDRVRSLVIKALGDDPDVEASSLATERESQQIFSSAEALDPPYSPRSLLHLYEVSAALRPNIDAYAVNIDGHGHRLEPVVDLESDNAEQVVADAILIERMMDADDGAVEDPTEAEIAARIKDLRRAIRVEKMRADAFLSFVAEAGSFAALRKQTRTEQETTGNAYWEELKDQDGETARFVLAPCVTMRLRKTIPAAVEVDVPYRLSPIKMEKRTVMKRFRTFVQVPSGSRDAVYFKEYGDPRVVSRKSGKVYANAVAMEAAEEGAAPAHAIIHFKIPSMDSPYGIPRWAGAMISILGSRQSEEVNFFYFENKSVPPLAILVSGGRLAKSSVARIEDYIENNLKGRRNFHKILVIEAETTRSPRQDSSAPQRPVLELKPLTDAQQDDALFQQYDKNNVAKVGASFRLPKLLRGDSDEINRATAFAALRFAEDQVFQPERSDFDAWVNGVLFPGMGFYLHRFVSQSPVTREPEAMGKLVALMVQGGILTPAEGRRLASDIFNVDITAIDEDWTRQPMPFTLAGLQTAHLGGGKSGGKKKKDGEDPGEDAPDAPKDDQKTALKKAASILAARAAVMKAIGDDDTEALRRYREGTLRDDDGTVVLEVPAEELASWFA